MKMQRGVIPGVLLAFAAAGSLALAQDTGQPTDPMMGPGMMGQGMMGWGMGGMGGMGPGMHGMMGRGMMMRVGPMIEGRLAYQKAELQITDAQSGVWSQYADAMRAMGSKMQDMHRTMMPAMRTGHAVERLDAHIKHMESMIEGLKSMKPATEALYNALSDEQKKTADLVLGSGCCMM